MMKKYFILLIILTVILSCQNNEKKTKIKPKISNITESVYASVVISPEVSYYPQPTRSGILDKIFISEGDVVKKDQILFQIVPNNDVNNQLANSKINLEEAKSNYLGRNNLLKNIEIEILNTKEQLGLDSINLKRQKNLYSQNIGKKIDLDQIKIKYANSKNQLALIEQKYIQTKTSLKSNYEKALNARKTGKEELDNYYVRSKIDGSVYSVNKEVGDYISAQEKFAEIGSMDQFKIEMDIDEVDITKVELGDTVLIILDAYKEEVFLAKVNKILPKKNDLSQTFSVESEFIKQPQKLYYGLSGEANIVVSKRSNALVIPTEYLLPNSRVLTSDGEKSVTLGMKNLEFVEILSGIDSTVSLIKPKD